MKRLFLHGAEAVIVALLFLAKQPNRVTPRTGCAGAGELRLAGWRRLKSGKKLA